MKPPPNPDDGAKKSPRGSVRMSTMVMVAVWLSLVVTAMGFIVNYSTTPGDSGTAPTQWPAQSKLPLSPNRPTLIMFAHPHCPCTEASLGELELLLTHCQGLASAYIVFIKPVGVTNDWMETNLWRKASQIPGLTVLYDEDTIETERFGAATSGTTVLYSPSGHLLFDGGITLSRGHSGDNPGRTALEASLHDGSTSQIKTPVFGCALFGGQCTPADAPGKP